MGSTKEELKTLLYPLIEYPDGLDFNDFYCRARVGMVTAHNFMIRGLNSIHNQAMLPQTNAERKSFAGYVLCLTEFTHHHHAGEEKFIFPEAEKRVPGSMAENLAQHKLFHDGFEGLETYFSKVCKDPSIYDGTKVRAMIEEFGTVFAQHLHAEIGTLERSKLVAIWPEEAEFKTLWEEMMDWIIKSASKLTTMPWVMSHHEESATPGFMKKEIPAVVVFLARYVFPWFHYSYWRWSPCDLHSVMKPNAKVGTVKPFLCG